MNPLPPEAWRQDFPIDWQQDHYVSRRDFVKFLVLISAGFTAGQLCIGLDQMWRGSRARALPRQRLCARSELAVGQSLAFRYPEEHEPCLLIRLSEDQWVAYHQKCTHLACAVVPQFEKRRLYCPCHEGAFDLLDGRPIQGPPRRPLPAVVLEVSESEIFAVGIHLEGSTV